LRSLELQGRVRRSLAGFGVMAAGGGTSKYGFNLQGDSIPWCMPPTPDTDPPPPLATIVFPTHQDVHCAPHGEPRNYPRNHSSLGSRNYSSVPHGSAQATQGVACFHRWGQSYRIRRLGCKQCCHPKEVWLDWFPRPCGHGSHTLGTQSQGDSPGALLGYSPPAHPLVSRCAHFCKFVLPPVPLAAIFLCILERYW
jgi:hypothetical protein